MIQQRRPIVEPVEVGAEAEIENLPDVRAQRNGLRLDEALDGVAARVFHHVDVIGGRGDGQDRGEGAIQEEPEAGGRELALERGALRFAHLLPVERLDSREIFQLRRTDFEGHRLSPFSDRKY